MKEKESLEIINTPYPLEGKDEHKLEYIKAMISLAREDIKHVMLYITLSLAIIFMFLTQIPIEVIFSLPQLARWFVFLGFIFHANSAFHFFLYIRNLHITQMKMTRCIVSLNVKKTRELWAGAAGVWQQHSLKYKVGKYSLGLGVVCLGIVLFYMLIIAEHVNAQLP